MNDWLIFAATLAVQLVIGAFVYGKLTNRVESHDDSIERMWPRIDDHERRISRMEGPERR